MTSQINNSDLGKRGACNSVGRPARWMIRGDPGGHASSSYDRLKIGTWNCRTLAEPGTLHCIINEMERMKMNVLGLTETHIKGVDDCYIKSIKTKKNFRVIYSGGEESRRGVAIIIDNDTNKALKYYNTYSERILYVKIKGKHHDTLMIQVYAPTTEYSDEDVEEFYDEITKIIKKCKKGKDKLIISGDFNAKVGNTKEGKIVGPHGLGEKNNRGSRLVDFCEKHNLFITNTWFEQKETARHTWISPGDRTRNQIDFVLCNQRYRNGVQNAKTRQDADCGSDHKPVIVTMQTKLKRINRKPKGQRWDLQSLKCKKEEFSKCTDENIRNMSQTKLNTEERWNRLKDTMKNSAMKIVGKKQKESKQPWMTEEILQKMEERRTQKNTISQQEYKAITRRIQKECRNAKEKYLQNKCSEIEHLDRHHSNKTYQKVREMQRRETRLNVGIRDKKGELLYEDADINKRWEEYIGEELFKDNRPEKPSIETEDKLTEITINEIEEAIKGLAKEKSPGDDEIPAEFLQALGPDGQEEMRILINDIYFKGELPKDFMSATFIPIPKVNKATKCSDHRTISLISHASKILLRIILNRINPIIESCLTETQFGFRKGKGTRDGIFLLRVISERMIENQENLFVCYIDYAKAFDRVKHTKLLEVMTEAGIPHHERKLIVELYWNQTARVRTTAGTTENIKIERGVRQGCILSPSLFNLYSEYLLKEALQECNGILLNGVNITNIRYADDTVILATNTNDLQIMINNIVQCCQEYGMEINAKKTKTMHFGKMRRDAHIFVDSTLLEQVDKYQYLGHTICADGDISKEIEVRIEKARMKFWQNKELLRRNIGLETKKRIINCYVYSVFNYGCEAWTYSRKIMKKIRAFEMWCYRRMLRISWKEHQRNEDILKKVNVKERLTQQLVKRKIRYAGHIMRGSSGPLLKLALEGKINGKRGRGRPRRSWMDDIKEWSDQKTYAEVKRKAEDRDVWRVMIANLRIEDGT